MSSKYWSWQAIKDWFEFCLILAALCACGYIAWKQLIYLYLMLILGGTAAGLAPIISPLYKIPDELIGIAPSLTQLFEISRHKIEQLNYFEESELQTTKQEFLKAKEIITRYVSKHPDLINNYPALREVYKLTDIGQKRSEKIYEEKVYQRQTREEQKRRKTEQYWQWVESERARKGLKHGVPPADQYNCPSGYPIRATENLQNEKFRGIYYLLEELKGVKVDWCFKNTEDAKADKFRRPKKTPPKYQP